MSLFSPENSNSFLEIMTLTTEGRFALSMNDGKIAYEKLSQKHKLIVKHFGLTRGPTGTSLVDLAEACLMVGKIREARKAVNDALVIFENLDRKDNMRIQLENSLLRVCSRQGHFFIVERVFLKSIERLRFEGSNQDVARAVKQDQLAKIYTNQQKYDKALPLLLDSIKIFEQLNLDEDSAVSSLYLARVYLYTNKYKESETYGHKSLEYSMNAEGENSVSYAIAADELSVTKGFIAKQKKNRDKAKNAIEYSNKALELFLNLTGRDSKEYLRSQSNNIKLKEMLAPLLDSSIGIEIPPIAIPTYLFISHAYDDDNALGALLEVLPKHVRPVIFEAINVPPTETVSEKLINGLLGSEGLIWIDSKLSNNSFWTAFEKDLACRKEKHIFKFDPFTKKITPYRIKPRNLWIAHLYHQSDLGDVNNVMNWLVNERSFEAIDDPKRFGNDLNLCFSELEPQERNLRLLSFRSFGAIYLIFISKSFMQDSQLLTHAIEQLEIHSQSTIICWLDQPDNISKNKLLGNLRNISEINSYIFKTRPLNTNFDKHQLDDLMVRLYWFIYKGKW